MSISALIVGVLAVGCGGSAGSQNKKLTLGYLEWTENVAISNLTEVLIRKGRQELAGGEPRCGSALALHRQGG